MQYMTVRIDKEMAIEVARRFLSQHFSVHSVDAILEEEMWIVTAQIEMFNRSMSEKVRIDSNTGRIADYILITPA